jgi:enamine deaminase RidA (YjgF/YER057c/UK114 family)
MSDKRAAIVSPTWEPFYKATKIPAAVRAGGELHVSGHIGEDPDGRFPAQLEDQVRGTFRNLTETLNAAGADWPQVVTPTSYHIGLLGQEDHLLRIASEFLDAPLPAWTAVGVTELWPPEALIEISCVAVLGEVTALGLSLARLFLVAQDRAQPPLHLG